MQKTDKEFRFYKESEQPAKTGDYEITVKQSQPTLAIDENGNIATEENNTYCLATDRFTSGFIKRSRSYFGIKHINRDHYVVIDTHITPSTNEFESALNNKRFELKFGIIELERDIYNSKTINNEKEQIIAPIVYDRIYVYDNLYPIMEKDGRYTYFCLDPESKNYRKQLVPLVLEAACPFNTKYEGFAECTIGGEIRFLAIDFIATEAITRDDLLTEEEVLSLIESYKAFKKLQRTTKSQVPGRVKSLYNQTTE